MKKNLLSLMFLSAVLFNTSIYNTSDFGVPFFWLVTLLAMLLSPVFFFKGVVIGNASHLFWVLVVVISVSLMQLVTLHASEVVLKQLISRSMLILFGAFLVLYAQNISNKESAIVVSRLEKIALLIVLLGGYEAVAIRVGLYVPALELANNPSFSNAVTGVENGWMESFRIRGVWGESSYSVMYVLFFGIFILNRALEGKCKSSMAMLLMAGCYSYLTYSRAVWALWVLLALFVNLAIFYKGQKSTGGLVAWAPCIALIASLFWPFSSLFLFQDASAIARMESILIGLRIWLDHPITGTGFNSYEVYAGYYAQGMRLGYLEPVSHSLFYGLLQQIGIFLLLMAYFFYRSVASVVGGWRRSYVVSSLAIAGGLFGDISYFALTWAVPALAVVMGRSGGNEVAN